MPRKREGVGKREKQEREIKKRGERESVLLTLSVLIDM